MNDKRAIPMNWQHELRRRDEEIDSLRARLEEANETLAAIQAGAIDALVIDTPDGQRIFTLEGAEHAYRALIEQMSEGALTLKADGTIHYCNQGFADLLKLPLERIIGTPAQRYIAKADGPAFARLLRQGLEGSARGELEFQAADGGTIPTQVGLSLLVDSGPAAVVSMVVTNLTEKKRTEDILASEQFVRRLIDSAPIGVAVVGRDLRYILVNAAYQAIAGDAAASIAGRSIAEAWTSEVARMIQPLVEQGLRTGEPMEFREHEAAIRGRSWWNVSQIPLRDAAGNTEALLILTQDVTERKLAEEELIAAKRSAERAKADAEAASKAKDHFLAVLSHELRTPLTPVLATVAMLQRNQLDADTRDSLEMIRRNVELEARLIDDLLDVTRIEKGKVELHRHPIELCTILRRAAEVCMPDIEARKLEFGIATPGGPYLINADAARLQQVFWNLLKNSVKFTPPGGRIDVRCRRDGAGHVIAEVHDSGEGIHPEALPRLFKAFEQGGKHTTRQFGGLGLGLAISKAMVELHGGTLTAHSQGKGKGATFAVRLPVLSARTAVPAAPTRPRATSSEAPARPVRILLVEDHSDTARIMKRLLKADGHEVELAGDVATALKLVEEQPFDLLLSDLGLPDGSGLDVMRAIRAKGLNLPGIALSGYGQENDLQQSREAGFADHLVKPVSLPELHEAIARLAGVSTQIANG